ncbi:MAG TPA: hypothetical protein VIB00_04730 [Pyrinomonadaceae bacterium]|jgi:hypothetical protein
MFCPQCGQQQSSELARFCARCGFPLDGVIHLLHNGGMLPAVPNSEGPKEMSPRRKGVRQGGILLLSGAVLVPILGVFYSFTDSVFLNILLAVTAIICFLGGPLRMIFAGLFEEGAPSRTYMPMNAYAPVPPIRPAVPGRNVGALPPPTATPTGAWRPRPTTAELAQPPSVTENTTRLLDKDEPREH